MFNPEIIAICGLKRAGKDTLARYIALKYGYKHVKISSTLKSIIKTAFNVTDDDLEASHKDQIHPKLGVSTRTVMDFIGTHVFQYELQKILPDVKRCFWINQLIENEQSHFPIVISDLRFQHEIDKLRAFRCLVIRIEKDGVCSDSLDSEKESGQLNVDFTLHNNDTPKSLFKSFDEVYISSKLKQTINPKP